jgi:hypothetical protein
MRPMIVKGFWVIEAERVFLLRIFCCLHSTSKYVKLVLEKSLSIALKSYKK